MSKAPKPNSTIRTQWIGDSLRELRKSRGISLRTAGAHLQLEASTVSRYESGDFPIRRVDLLELLSFYGVSEESRRSELLNQCEEAWRTSDWDQHREDLGGHFVDVPWIESTALASNIFEHRLVHGLLQTPAYAEEVIRQNSPPSTSVTQVQQWTALRMKRKQAFENQNSKFNFILEESVLSRPVGHKADNRHQLANLLKQALEENVCIRIIETSVGPHPAILGSFAYYQMPDQYPDVAHVETLVGSVYAEGPDIEKVETAWKAIDKLALSPKASSALISDYMKEYE